MLLKSFHVLIFALICTEIQISGANTAPSCTAGLFTFSVPETSSVGYSITQLDVPCTDADAGADGNLTFTFVTGSSEFALDSSTGELTLAAGLDYESFTWSYNIEIQVSDGGTPSLSTTVMVNVEVGSENEFDPNTDGPYTVDVDENFALQTTFLTLTPYDEDVDSDFDFQNVKCQIQTSADSDFFIIDPVLCELMLVQSLDFETAPTMSLNVEVVDQNIGTPRTSVAAVTVNVQDVNDNAPSCGADTFVTSYAESTTAVYEVLQLTCTDQEDGTLLDYAMLSGDTTKFEVDATGKINMKTAIDVDTEASVWTLLVGVSDVDTVAKLTSTLTINVVVTGVDDNPPVWASPENGAYTVNLDESAPLGSILTISATDSDQSGTQDSAVIYTLETVTANFNIDSSSGALSLLTGLDAENSPSISLSIGAYSSNQIASKILGTVTITVQDINDNTPVFSQVLFTASHAEGSATPIGSTLATVAATDDDSGTNAQITYSISNGTAATGCGSLSLGGVSGIISNGALLDYETTTSCTLVVLATDGGTPALTATATVFLNILPDNEAAPSFSGAITTNVDENTAIGTSVADAVATDADFGLDGTIKYSLSSSAFSINEDTGVIYLAAALDYETTPSYSFAVTATDQSTGTQKTDVVTVTINVNDKNDNAPVFSKSLYTSSHTEGTSTPINSGLETVVATDDDIGTNAQITYSIVSGTAATGCGSLSLDDATGVVSNGALLDYETTFSCTLVVMATDGGTPALTGTATVVVEILPDNEDTPTFAGAMSVTVDENAAIGTSVADVVAVDTDAGLDGTLLYYLTSSLFTIDVSTGTLYVAGAIDFESSPSHSLSIEAVDQSLGTQKTGTVAVTVNVADKNDNAPVFAQSLYTISHTEGASTPINSGLETVVATDDDTGTNAQITYSIASGTAATGCGSLSLDGATGVLSNGALLDYETTFSCTLVVMATDGGTPALTGTATVVLEILPDNEDTPTFAGAMSVTVDENAAIGTSVADVVAVDTDAGLDGTLLYYLTSSLFTIDVSTGTLYVAGAIDFESSPSHSLSVEAVDQSLGTQKTGTVAVTVNVADKNDNSPLFTQSVYEASVTEATGTVPISVITVTASDDDSGTNGQITYAISSGNSVAGCSDLSIAASGSITSASLLDYETVTSCKLVVTATDAGVPALTGSATVVVYILPVNEATPDLGSDFTVTVSESTSPGTSVASVVASDADFGLDGKVLFSFQPPTSDFGVDPVSGDISLGISLDRETTTSYTIVIEGVDLSDSVPRTGTVTITFDVTDENDNAPICDPVAYELLDEPTLAVNDLVYQTVCTDDDDGVNSDLVYSITAGNTNSDFTIDGTGQVLVANMPSVQNYVLEITVSDQGAVPLSCVIQVNIDVLGNPVFTSLPLSTSIAEDFFVTDVVFTVTVDTTSGVAFFEIVSGDDGKFKINAVTGIIYVAGVLDRETVDTYSLTIRAIDSLSGYFTDESLSITLDDVNDNTPDVPKSYFNLAVAEDLAVNTLVQSLASTDKDLGTNADLTYSIQDGNNDGMFSLDPNSGDLKTAKNLDVETTRSYTLDVVVVDGGVPKLTSTIVVYVQVTDVDEFAPAFLTVGNAYTHSIPENTALGALVFTVTAQDQDVNTSITYSITAGNDGTFLIGSSSGNITITKYLDRETTDTYTLVITADNGAGDTVDGTLDLTITDVNDNVPTFSSDPYTFSVDEDESTGVKIGQVTVSDLDLDAAGAFNLSIAGGNALNHFALDGDFLVVNSVLDYETMPNYIITIKAEDGGMPVLSSTATVNVVVTPIYPQPLYAIDVDTISIPESKALGSIVYDCDTTFGGAVEGTDLEYIIESNTGGGKFSVDPTNGQLIVTDILDRETLDTYVIVLRAENVNDNTRRDKLTLTVQISDVNDNSPVFSSASYTLNTDEGLPTSSTVGTVNAVDSDLGTNSDVTYSIIAGELMSDFAIDPSSGEITNAVVLNSVTKSSYLLTVKAQDRATVPMTSTCNVIINVNDVNDQTPSFSQTTFTISVSEGVAIGETIAVVSASDGDTGTNGMVSYSIFSGNALSHFNLKTTGELEIKNTIDRETLSDYSLIIEASDSGTPKNSATATYSITVVDENDNSPAIVGSPYILTVPRSTPTFSSVISVTASDVDAGNNAILEYFIVSGNTDSTFSISVSTGEVSTLTSLTSAPDQFSLLIEVTDKGFPRKTSTASVLVTLDPPLSPSTSDYSFTVAENSAIGTMLGTIGTDPVHTAGATVQGQIISGDSYNNFNIGATSRVLSTAKILDFEAQSSYYLTVLLEEVGNPAISYNKLVLITVVDENDNNPDFGTASYSLDLVENTPVNQAMLQLSATDLDDGVNGQVLYSISPSNPAAMAYFEINSASGLISVKQSVDYELVSFITFEVQAVDGGSPARTGIVTILVNVIDVLDSSAASGSAFMSFEIPTSADNGDVIGTLTTLDFGLTATATDTVSFSMLDPDGVFGIDSNGKLYLSDKSFVFESTRYIFWSICQVKDGNNNVTSSSILIRVDTFDPNTEMVSISHGVSKDIVEQQINGFKAALQTLFPFPKKVGIWKVNSILTSNRRRLLASQSESLVYVVSDETTDKLDAINTEKGFETEEEILAVLQQSSDGTPVTALSSALFATFPVDFVQGYSTQTTSVNWVQTTTGIAVLATIGASVILLLAILVAYFVCTRERQYTITDGDPVSQKNTYMKNQNMNLDKSPLYASEKISPSNSIATLKYTDDSYEDTRNLNVNHGPPFRKKSKQDVNITMMEGASFDGVPGKMFASTSKKTVTKDGGDIREYAESLREDTLTPRNVILRSPPPRYEL